MNISKPLHGKFRWAGAAALALICSALPSVVPLGPARSENAPAVAWPGPARSVEISRPFGGSEIVIGTSSRTAGAIDSLTWNGRQFINAYDHGRELQSAASFDGYGECLNPTEAGSLDDGVGPTSTSLLLSLRAGRTWLETRNQMAFWLWPQDTSEGCPRGPGPYSTARSDYTLAKRVVIGAAGVENAIEYQATFYLPRPHAAATFEVVTGYMPPEFSRFWTYDPGRRQLRPLSDGPGEQGLPVILSTPDGSHAMGVYSPDLPQQRNPDLGYGRFRFATLPGPGNATVKWNCVFRERNVPAGDHAFRCFVVVGTLDDVRIGISALYETKGLSLENSAEQPLRAGPGPQLPPPVNASASRVAESVPLFVGVERGCNAGVVTTNPDHMGCATRPIGSTVSTPGGQGAAVYVGTTAGVNAGVVSTNPRHLNASSRAIGFLQPKGSSGTRLFVGKEPGCNAGVTTTDPTHLACSTLEIGTTSR